MGYKFSQRSLDRMDGVDPKLIEIAHRALELSIIDFGIPEYGGLRSAVDQRILFDRKVSRADGQVKLSNHQSGNALDFYAYVDGKASWDLGHMAVVACAFFQAAADLGYRIEWGGLWKGYRDMPHIQLKG